jgi:hypothetical protein
MAIEKAKVNAVIDIKKFDKDGKLVLHKHLENRRGVQTEEDIVKE